MFGSTSQPSVSDRKWPNVTELAWIKKCDLSMLTKYIKFYQILTYHVILEVKTSVAWLRLRSSVKLVLQCYKSYLYINMFNTFFLIISKVFCLHWPWSNFITNVLKYNSSIFNILRTLFRSIFRTILNTLGSIFMIKWNNKWSLKVKSGIYFLNWKLWEIVS